MRMRFGVICAVIVVVSAIALFSRYSISPVDVLTGKERIIGRQTLPNGEELKVVQYWNNGDFYDLELRHITKDGSKMEFVIDPDCFRIPKREFLLDAPRAEIAIVVGKTVWGRYRWTTRELVRKNGVILGPLQTSNKN